MDRPYSSRAVAVALLMSLTSYGVAGAAPQQLPVPSVNVVTTGVVTGTAWKGDSQPYPQAKLRLRNVSNGHDAARTTADAEGRFRFDRVEPGPYVVELLSNEDKVLAVGDLFGVPAGGQVATMVRLSTVAPFGARFLGNAALAAIAAASTLGITTVGSSGRPASGQ